MAAILNRSRASKPFLCLLLETANMRVVGAVVALVVEITASKNVNINRFSLHAVYRNQLARGYLGAARQARNPDRFTGFDDSDNIHVQRLWPPQATSDGQNTFGLFHVVNISLNVVESKTARLAGAQSGAIHCQPPTRRQRAQRLSPEL